MSNESWARLALAFSTVRVDVTWQQVEQAQGIYNFSVYDRLFARCTEVGALPYIILDYDNRLYGRCPEGHCLCTANAVAAFVNYAVAVVQRFSHAMAFELWNDPNLHGARPHNMPVSAYSALLTAVGGALKNSRTHAVLVAGATAGVDAGFIGALSKNGPPMVRRCSLSAPVHGLMWWTRAVRRPHYVAAWFGRAYGLADRLE